MAFWLIPANTKFYDVFSAFARHETYWPMNAKLATGDIVYVYLAAPFKQIGFRCEVLGVGYEFDTIRDQVSSFIKGDIGQGPDRKPFMKLGLIFAVPIEVQSELSLSRLRENGLTGMLMGARRLENNQDLLDYIGKALD